MKKVILMTLLAVVAASSVYAGTTYRQPAQSGARNSTAPTPPKAGGN